MGKPIMQERVDRSASTNRDRAGEFTATGSIAELRAKAGALQAQLRRDLASGFDPDGPLRAAGRAGGAGPAHGQVEVYRNALLRSLVGTP